MLPSRVGRGRGRSCRRLRRRDRRRRRTRGAVAARSARGAPPRSPSTAAARPARSRTRVGVELRAVLERELLRLDHQVQRVGDWPHRACQVEAFEDVQHLQHGDALAVRRQLPDVRSRDRSLRPARPTPSVRGEILAAEETAVAASGSLDGASRSARRRTRRGRCSRSARRPRESGIRERFAVGRRAAARHEHGRERPATSVSAAAPAAHAAAMTWRHGKAVRARNRSTGASSSRIGNRPKRACSSNQPSTAPGHADGQRAALGMCVEPRAREVARSSATAASGRSR